MATTVSQPGYYNLQALTTLGALGVGMRLYTYSAGTTTHKNAYTEATGTTVQTYTSDGIGGEYIALDARGELPSPLYLTSGAYDLALKTSAGATVWTRRADPSSASTAIFIPAGSGAETRTAQDKLRETVSAADFTGYDSTGGTDSAAAITAALAAANEVLIVGTPLIASTITVPTGKKLTFQGGLGNTMGAYPPSYLIKKSTMTTNGITISERAWVSGGGLFCQGGNTGDGVALVGNSAKLDNFLVHAAGGVGVRVGTTAGANCNSFQLDHVTSQYNGSHGFYLHDGKAAEGADANAGTLTQCFAQYNTGDGFHLKHCFWNTLLNCLSEQNTGWGLYISATVNGSASESRYHTVIGGDYNEVNVGGVGYIGGYACSIYQPDQNQGFTLAGTFVNHFGGSNSTIDTITLGRGQIVFPAVAVPSANANTLDDYEEGTFTPDVIGTTLAGTADYVGAGGFQLGRYTKIGRIVFIDIALKWQTGTGTGNMRISGLPFTANANTYGCLAVGQASNVVLTASNVLRAFVDPAVAYVSLTQDVVGGGASTSVAYDAAGTLLLSGSYTV